MEYQLSWVYTSHLNKSVELSGVERVSGSSAYVNVPRAGFIATKDPVDQNRRLLVPIPGNLARPMDALAYYIQEDGQECPIVLWQNKTIHVDIDEVMARVDPHARKVLEEAAEWLRTQVENGPVPSEQIFKDAAKQGGWSKDQINRAKGPAGVRSRKHGFDRGWVMELVQTMEDEAEVGNNIIDVQSSRSSPSSTAKKMAEINEDREECEERIPYNKPARSDHIKDPAYVSPNNKARRNEMNSLKRKVLSNARGQPKAFGP